MMKHEPLIFFDPILKSSLYDELEVQEIFWPESEHTTYKSHRQYHSRGRKRYLEKAYEKWHKLTILDGSNNLENKFDYLSDELMLKIFGYLDRYSVVKCSQVCHRWMKIGYDPSLWKIVEIYNKNLAGSLDLGTLLTRNVSCLKMVHCEVSGPVSVPASGSHEKRIFRGKSKRCQSSCRTKESAKNLSLQYFDVSLCLFADNSLLSLLKRCRSLKFLSLEGAPLSDDLMSAIGGNANLRELNLALCKGVTSNGISKLTARCKKLVSINLSWLALSKDVLLEVACSFPFLEEIDLSGNKVGMDDDVVQTIVIRCPNLKVIDISDCPLIGNGTIDSIIRTKLQRISLSRCHGITAPKICQIASMETLEHLEMFGFTNHAAMDRIKTANPSLTINSNIISPIAKMSRDRIAL